MRYMILLGLGLIIALFVLIMLSVKVWYTLKSKGSRALAIGINLLVISLLAIFIFVVSAATVHNYLYETSANLVQLGKYSKAIKMLKGSLSIRNVFCFTPQLLDVKVFSTPLFFVQEVDIRRTLARAYRGSQDYPNSMKEYQSILAWGRDDFEAIAGLAECSFLQRDFESAKRYYKKLLTISYAKRDFNYHYTIGRAYMVLLDYGKAIIHFKKALEFGEREEMVKRYLKVCYREAGSR